MEIKISYDMLDDKCFQNYLNYLVGKFFKILPISESEPSTLADYLSSLQMELIGNANFIQKIRHDAQFLSLVGTLQYLKDNDCTHREIKRETLKCTNIVQKLIKKYGGEMSGNS